LYRPKGQDTQRAFAAATWDRRAITGLGQELLLTAYARGDVYHSSQNLLTDTIVYRGEPGWQARAIGAVAAPTAVLIRPDGYVAWVGEGSPLGLTDALTKWFGAPPRSPRRRSSSSASSHRRRASRRRDPDR
jgi:hypothetical protein